MSSSRSEGARDFISLFVAIVSLRNFLASSGLSYTGTVQSVGTSNFAATTCASQERRRCGASRSQEAHVVSGYYRTETRERDGIPIALPHACPTDLLASLPWCGAPGHHCCLLLLSDDVVSIFFLIIIIITLRTRSCAGCQPQLKGVFVAMLAMLVQPQHLSKRAEIV